MNAGSGELAVSLLLATRAGDDDAWADASSALESLTHEQLRHDLAHDDEKLAFWIDIYNAAVQRRPTGATASTWSRLRLFGRPIVTVAGRRLSLDDIEHGLLRRSRWKLGLGYLSNPRPSAFERAHRVAHVDARIHFTLNCGARSCPPIAAYRADRIGEQLDLATRSYLSAEVVHEGGTLRVPSAMLWFIGDFGGVAGMRRFLDQHGVAGSAGRIRFLPYDWTPAPDRWSPDP